MPQPTLVNESSSGFGIGVGATATAATFTWQTGDVFHVLGLLEDSGYSFTLVSTGGANLTFSQVTNNTAASNCNSYYWRGTATGAGSGTITTTASSSGVGRGIYAWQYRDTSGQGTPVTGVGSATTSLALTRGQANSHVIAAYADWNADPDVTVTVTPATNGAVVVNTFATNYTAFVIGWGDQGAAGGPVNYGFTAGGTVKLTSIAVEVFGTAAATGATTAWWVA